jgi:hypothetical protein
MAAYPQVVSPPPGMVGYSSMSPPPVAGYVPGFPQPGSRGYNAMANYGAPGIPPIAPRNPQQFATPPQHSPIPTGAVPQKGTLRPGQEIRVGKQTVVIEKYLSEGKFALISIFSRGWTLMRWSFSSLDRWICACLSDPFHYSYRQQPIDHPLPQAYSISR